MTKEEIIKQIETKSRILYEMSAEKDLLKILDSIEKAIKKVQTVQNIIDKLGDKE